MDVFADQAMVTFGAARPASGLIPTFASHGYKRASQCRNHKNPSKLLLLVDFLNLAFACAPDVKRHANVKEDPPRHSAPDRIRCDPIRIASSEPNHIMKSWL